MQQVVCHKHTVLLERTVPMCCRYSIKRMDPKKHVFLLTPMDPDSRDATFVAKMVATPYPEQLHQELSRAGLAPELRGPVQKYPGGVMQCFCAIAFIPPVAASMRRIHKGARYISVAAYGVCFCMQ